MPMTDRAAQFSPFAALTGYDAAILETAREDGLPNVRVEVFDGLVADYCAAKGIRWYVRGLRGAADYQRKLRVPEAVEAPVKKDAALGSAVYYNDGTDIARVELVAAEDIRQDESFLSRLAAFLRGLFQ